MGVACMAAGDIGVEALDLVGEACLLEEIERPVDRRRFGRAFSVEVRQQVVGLGRRIRVIRPPRRMTSASASFRNVSTSCGLQGVLA